MQQELLPLFPLQMVLFPGARVLLHIFEERYKEMIGEAIRRRSEFGIVLANEGSLVNTGCTALVDRVIHKYDDGRMDIVAAGRRRFEIVSLDEERSYLRGQVDFFDDDDSPEPAAETQARVEKSFEELRGVDPEADNLPPSPDIAFSFRVADSVRDLNFRQVMLATRSESERVRRLAEFLPPMVETMRRVAYVRGLAPQNGHAKHIES
jgi:Lon protease-like protein